MGNKKNNSKKSKDLFVLVEQQARQIITLEKKLYDTRDRLNREVEGFENLRHLTEKVLGGIFSVEEITNYVIEYLIYEEEIEKVLLFTSPEEGILKLQSVGGYKEEKVKELEGKNFKIEGLLEEIVKTKRTKIFDIKSKTDGQPLIKESIKRFELSYFLAASLVGREEKLIGVLLAGYSEEKTRLILPQFTDEDIILFSALVNQSSLFIENARINIELQGRIEELERFNKLSVGRELKMIELKKEVKKLKKLKK